MKSGKFDKAIMDYFHFTKAQALLETAGRCLDEAFHEVENIYHPSQFESEGISAKCLGHEIDILRDRIAKQLREYPNPERECNEIISAASDFLNSLEWMADKDAYQQARKVHAAKTRSKKKTTKKTQRKP